MTSPSFSPLTALAQRLTVIVGELRAKVATRGGRDRAAVPLLTLAWLRLGRLAARFEVLVARVVAGRPFAPSRPRVRAARIVVRPEGVLRLPTTRAWLIDMVQETAQLIGHVEGLLADPEMVALLAAAPNAGRILRPLCPMLAMDLPPVLALPARATSAPGKVRVKRAPRTPRVEPPTAVALVWAAIRDRVAVMEREAAAAPEPVRRKPPWRMNFGR